MPIYPTLQPAELEVGWVSSGYDFVRVWQRAGETKLRVDIGNICVMLAPESARKLCAMLDTAIADFREPDDESTIASSVISADPIAK